MGISNTIHEILGRAQNSNLVGPDSDSSVVILNNYNWWKEFSLLDLGMAFVDNWVVGKEKGCYWLSNDIVGLVGNLAV